MITVENVSKTIKGKTILSNISFEIATGDCLALIGPNGAGKTTLMSCLLGDLKISKGSILLNNLSPRNRHLKEMVAVLPQENVLPQKLKVCELIDFFKSVAATPLSDREINQMLLFSDEQKEQLTEKLSGGQKRLLQFVLCLISQPKILFLDEPTAAMDTSTRQHFWKIIQNLKEKGVTIFYSSHYIEEVEHTAERILVLHRGKLLRDTTPFAMREAEHEKQLTLSKIFLPIVEKLSDINNIEVKNDTVTFMTKEIDSVWQKLQEQGCQITDIEIQNKSLLNTLFEQTEEMEK
ncbi:ABC transporter ATP-binding protein [Streptococcus equinus]|uniref:ABC transporter ATP-binding protein n=1 Tax=Streptococcus equinus TaxID=1335 RepID=UPI00089243E0|nr:ABC transporter ATP-binding protein [Streptococcus equinus]SDQ05165.1 ABC-2 type transport system ATP-binding protein [Streptococcus equinus]SEN47562.1 ABC-2 type transport system ATP-binding protein [Streptococcus equinus]VED90855.1 ABC transporter ATP-binding protein [Streptococcus equinus]VTS82838.1 ABC transporter ATP-binding protein [Streptococcus equinus]